MAGTSLQSCIILAATIAAENIARTMNTHQDGPLSRDFERSIPMMFYQALDVVLPRFREIFAQFDITQPQWRVLRVLWDEDGQNLTSIADRTLIVPTVLVGIVDRLERDGRVERRRSKEDRRRVHVFLTESGHALRSDVAPLVDEAYVQLQAVLSAQEWRDLYSAIDKLIESDAAAKASST
ncbi:organic hydroperoxide resistance transcriptional regulator [bacterium BMS3Bbin02]|nr:organic hydroperoxide resistance transcriptional regulator [bacterium BMS3Bbin02]